MSEQENLKVDDLVDVMASGKIESISESGYMVRVHGELVPFGKLQVTPFSPSIYSMTQTAKHDGDLGDRYSVAWHYNDINIQDQGAEFVALTPLQAIKLLAWLEEEYPNLWRLYRETIIENC